MAQVEREHVEVLVSLREHHERSVRETDLEIAVLLDDPQGSRDVGPVEGLENVGSLRDIREDTLDRQIGRYLDRDDMVTTVMSVVTSTMVA